MRDAVRLAMGTLTVLRVRPPARLDRRTAGWAMLLAPLVGLLLGLLLLAVLWLLGVGSLHVVTQPRGWYVYAPGPSASDASLLSPLLAAVLAVAALALLTRGMHLDGLADTADGLGSGKPAEQALGVMRSGDVGPFGVVALVLCLLLQVAALEACFENGVGPTALVVAVVLSRATLPLLCWRPFPAARRDGLGATVAGSVGSGMLALSLVIALLLAAVAFAVGGSLQASVGFQDGDGFNRVPAWPVLHPLLLVVLPWAAAALLGRRCVRRLGGVTGDVLGAGVELSFTLCLVLLAMP